MVGSAAIKQGRSANRKHTYFFFWPYLDQARHLSGLKRNINAINKRH